MVHIPRDIEYEARRRWSLAPVEVYHDLDGYRVEAMIGAGGVTWILGYTPGAPGPFWSREWIGYPHVVQAPRRRGLWGALHRFWGWFAVTQEYIHGRPKTIRECIAEAEAWAVEERRLRAIAKFQVTIRAGAWDAERRADQGGGAGGGCAQEAARRRGEGEGGAWYGTEVSPGDT